MQKIDTANRKTFIDFSTLAVLLGVSAIQHMAKTLARKLQKLRLRSKQILFNDDDDDELFLWYG